MERQVSDDLARCRAIAKAKRITSCAACEQVIAEMMGGGFTMEEAFRRIEAMPPLEAQALAARLTRLDAKRTDEPR
jgi:hypothetical protein